MKLCLSQATIQGTPTEKALEHAARAGFGHFDLWWPQIRSEPLAVSPLQLREVATAERIELASVSGVVLELAGDQADWESTLADFRQAATFASEAGVPLICFSPGSSSAEDAQTAFSLAAGRMSAVVDIAERESVDLALEFRSDSGWLASLPTAQAFVSIFASDRLGLCFDAFHFYCGPSKTEDLTPEAIAKIRSVQLSDLIGTPREFATESDRILPGEGDFDLRSILGCFRSTDYDGLICAESPNPMLWQFAPDRVADMAHQSLLRFFVTAETEH